ncbi:MAG: DUF11 domain-containing protein, partial [Thermoplasmatales archaeon]
YEGKTGYFYVDNDLIPIKNHTILIGSENTYLVDFHIFNAIQNFPPFISFDPSPSNVTSDVSINVDLSWKGGDPDDDPVTYDVYFGTTSPPPLMIYNQSDTCYNPGMISYNITYYWMVMTWDDKEASAKGPEWVFTTEEEPNPPPVVTDIPDQSIVKGSTFATINLDDYVSDVEDADADISWTYSGNTYLNVSIVARIATITLQDRYWYGEETITFTAENTRNMTASDDATFNVITTNDTPIINDTLSSTQTFSKNSNSYTISAPFATMSAHSWPTTWILFDTDPNEDGTSDDYKDVQYAYYNVDNEYIYFKLELFGYANFSVQPDSRYKIFIDTDIPHNMGWSGGNVIEAEYILLLEDTPNNGGDGHGEIYLVNDIDNDGLFSEYSPWASNHPAAITNTSVVGYNIAGHNVSLYVRLANITNPSSLYFTWATDNEDPTIHQTSAHDRSDFFFDADLSKADISIVKTDDPDPINAGGYLTYTLNVTNNGPHSAENVNITDTLPSGVTFNYANPTANGSSDPTYWWIFSSIDVGNTETITINITVDSGTMGIITNNATAINDTYDPYPSNNVDSEDTNCNIPPIANNDSASAPEDTAVDIDVTANDYDVDGSVDPTSVVIVSGVSDGVTSVNATTGVVTYTPDLNYFGSDSFTYEVDDDDGATSNVATVSITVGDVNDPPNSPSNPVPDNGASEIAVNTDLSWNCSDLDPGDTLTYDVYFGTDSSPPKVSSNQSNNTYDPGTLDLGRIYYWKIIAWDNHSASNESPVWSFSSKSLPPPSSSQNDPTADAGGPYYGFVDEEIEFDGTNSTDNDENGESIVRYDWKFFNEDTWHEDLGVNPNHTYEAIGEYTVTLRVYDNEGSTHTDTATVYITIPNNPPTQPTLDGPTFGHKQTSLDYDVVSTDLDNDTIRYVFDWGDDTNTTTEYLTNGTTTTQNHSWSTYNEYLITVYAEDINNAISGITTYTVLIDVHPIDDIIIGELIDLNSNNTWDVFYNDATGNQTIVGRENNTYLIDSDGDGKWDYAYNLITELSPYVDFVIQKWLKIYEEEKTPGFEAISLLAMIVLILVILRKKRR